MVTKEKKKKEKEEKDKLGFKVGLYVTHVTHHKYKVGYNFTKYPMSYIFLESSHITYLS